MQNFFETLRDVLEFKKFQLEELLFVEYTCPLAEEDFGVWSQRDYIIYVLSGKKSWKTTEGTTTAGAGDIMYVKKGGSIVRQFFQEDFCMLGFFLTDDFIRTTIGEVKDKLRLPRGEDFESPQVTRIGTTSVLSSYLQTMLHYFEGQVAPMQSLLELKFKELLISIISDPKNVGLAHYFTSLTDQEHSSLSYIMEHNYCYNLSLEEMAKLCHRSLSSFRRDFKKLYNTTPGKWLLAKRLDRAAVLLHQANATVTQVAFDSGFEDTSHFSRAFKDKFGESPLYYHRRVTAGALEGS